MQVTRARFIPTSAITYSHISTDYRLHKICCSPSWSQYDAQYDISQSLQMYSLQNKFFFKGLCAFFSSLMFQHWLWIIPSCLFIRLPRERVCLSSREAVNLTVSVGRTSGCPLLHSGKEPVTNNIGQLIWVVAEKQGARGKYAPAQFKESVSIV